MKDSPITKVLLAGATGYLGSFILQELLTHACYPTRVIVRSKKKLAKSILENPKAEIVNAEVTNQASVEGCCKGIDVVISTVGITQQKEGLTYMDVDYQANINLLRDAKQNGVRKFIYVSVFNGENLTHLKICKAKEKFVHELKNSGLDYCIIRPTGYFSDMGEFYKMAAKGRVVLFGDGENKMNPIHGQDLAEVCVNAISRNEKEIDVGGPQVLSYNQIASLAFSVAGKNPHVTRISPRVTNFILAITRLVSTSKFYGPIEFFITVLTTNLTAPGYGTRSLKEYFRELKTASG